MFNKICIIFNNFLKNKDIIVQLKYPQILINYDIELVHFVLDFVCKVALTFQLFSYHFPFSFYFVLDSFKVLSCAYESLRRWSPRPREKSKSWFDKKLRRKTLCENLENELYYGGMPTDSNKKLIDR